MGSGGGGVDDGLLSLKWNNHRSTFLHILTALRDKPCHSDVTLACSGQLYPVHKLVLSSCSAYFASMFDSTQCQHPVIVLKDIASTELEALLDYMYVGEVDVKQSALASLIKAAECLHIKGLAAPDEEPGMLGLPGVSAGAASRTAASKCAAPRGSKRSVAATNNNNSSNEDEDDDDGNDSNWSPVTKRRRGGGGGGGGGGCSGAIANKSSSYVPSMNNASVVTRSRLQQHGNTTIPSSSNHHQKQVNNSSKSKEENEKNNQQRNKSLQSSLSLSSSSREQQQQSSPGTAESSALFLPSQMIKVEMADGAGSDATVVGGTRVQMGGPSAPMGGASEPEGGASDSGRCGGEEPVDANMGMLIEKVEHQVCETTTTSSANQEGDEDSGEGCEDYGSSAQEGGRNAAVSADSDNNKALVMVKPLQSEPNNSFKSSSRVRHQTSTAEQEWKEAFQGNKLLSPDQQINKDQEDPEVIMDKMAELRHIAENIYLSPPHSTAEQPPPSGQTIAQFAEVGPVCFGGRPVGAGALDGFENIVSEEISPEKSSLYVGPGNVSNQDPTNSRYLDDSLASTVQSLRLQEFMSEANAGLSYGNGSGGGGVGASSAAATLMLGSATDHQTVSLLSSFDENQTIGGYSNIGGGSHRCPICQKDFGRNWLLKRHMRTHTGEKPYACVECPYRSAYRYQLSVHEASVHSTGPMADKHHSGPLADNHPIPENEDCTPAHIYPLHKQKT